MCIYFNRECSFDADVSGQLTFRFVEDHRPQIGHLFVIVDRGEPVGDTEFCSAACIETYVKRLPGSWKIAAEYFSWNPKRNVTMHRIEIRKRQEGLRIPREAREAGAQ